MIGLAWPRTPVLGQVYRGFQWDGRTWSRSTAGPRATWQNVQVFTASGRYEPSDNLVAVTVECWGPGGGGGWATGDQDGITNYSTAAGGGGSGGYSKRTLPASEVFDGADVVIGLGGIVSLGTVGGGQTAGVTNFGGLCMAMGGGDAQAFDGSGVVSGAHGTPGIGAAAGVGDLVMPGAAGGMWAAVKINLVAQHLDGMVPGLGGQLLGGAQWPARPWLYTNQNGLDGLPNSGAGGGGAQVNGSPGTTLGGRGGTGICVVTELCSLDTEGPPGPLPPTSNPRPGVPLNMKIKAAVTHVPPVHVEPAKK